MIRLDDKVAIITGAGSGIGQASAEYFASLGAKVVVSDVSLEAAEGTARDIVGAGGVATAVACDVASQDDVARMVEAAIEQFGVVDVLWNNAGIQHDPAFVFVEDMSLEDFDRVVRVNLMGTFLCCKHVVPHMKKNGGGAIISTASTAGITAPHPGIGGYNASKAGVIALTKSLSGELGPFNIRVNAIAPSSVNTPRARNRKKPGLPLPAPWRFLDEMPHSDATRAAEAHEVARLGAFLCSDGAGPLTGATVPIDGGMTAR